MKKKLIKQAGQAITITLPIDWIRNNNLKYGDEIELNKNANSLILSTNNKQSTGKIHVNTKNNLSKLNNIYINSAYALGIDEIDLETSSTKSIDLSQNIGFTIMNQKNNILKIKDISGLGQENAEEIFKRVFQLIISFYESAIDNIINNQNADENTINNIDSEINKFVLFLQRSIMKQNNIDETSGKILFAYSFGLEHIGDEISRMWKANLNNKIKKSNELKEILEVAKTGIHLNFEICFTNSKEKIIQTLELKCKLREILRKIIKKNKDEVEIAMHAVRIIEDLNDLNHLAVMKGMQKDIT